MATDPTTTNIPTTDPALLAAQAKAGQAGVDAYNAALAQMQTQRSGAVAQAMKEAQARAGTGGPVDPAAGQQAAGVYDQRIASLTQGLSNFQQQTAGGEQRLSDFNAAVNSARGLIPGQVELATAPIRAQTAFQVAQIGASGEQKVNDINAQTELAKVQLAMQQAAAAAAAAKAGKAKAAANISNTDLAAAATQGAAQKYTDLADQIANYGKGAEPVAQSMADQGAAAMASASGKSSGVFGNLINAAKQAVANAAAKAAQKVTMPADLVGLGSGNQPNAPLTPAQLSSVYASGEIPTGAQLGKPLQTTEAKPPDQNVAARMEALNSIVKSMTGGRQAINPQTGQVGQTLQPGNALRGALGAVNQRVGQGVLGGIAQTRADQTAQLDTPDMWRAMMSSAIGDLNNQGIQIDPNDVPNVLGYGSMSGMKPSDVVASLQGKAPKDIASGVSAGNTISAANDKQVKAQADAQFSALTGGLTLNDVPGDDVAKITAAKSPQFPEAQQQLEDAIKAAGDDPAFSVARWLNLHVPDQVIRAILKKSYG